MGTTTATKRKNGIRVIVTAPKLRSEIFVDSERDGSPFLVVQEGVLSWDDIEALRAIMARAQVRR